MEPNDHPIVKDVKGIIEWVNYCREADKNAIFNAAIVILQKDKVSVILPSTVKEIEADAKGITLSFEKVDQDKDKAKVPYNANSWQKYCGILGTKGGQSRCRNASTPPLLQLDPSRTRGSRSCSSEVTSTPGTRALLSLIIFLESHFFCYPPCLCNMKQ